jgi:hypothetical protein
MGPGEKLVRAAVRRPLAFFGAFALLALLAGAAESGLAVLRSKRSEPGLGARWIWPEGAARSGAPRTFYAARDFELPEGVEKAWLSIAADESYVLWVNGRAAGSGAWRDQDGGQAADLYEISDRLERGVNRLVVELRSSSGAGGLLATLRLGEQGRPTLVTGRDWRIFREADPRLLRGLARLDQLDGEEPRLWQWPPTGRWRTGRLAPRPSLAAPDPLRPGGLCPRRLRFPGTGIAWSDLPSSPACAVPGVSDQNLWDFGDTVEGILEMGLPAKAEPQPALVYFLDREPDEKLVEKRPEVLLQPAPGAWLWRDTAVRRFRYLVVIGVAPSGFMRLLPATPEQKEAYAPPPPPRGVFGLEAPSGPTALEASVWQRYLDPQ